MWNRIPDNIRKTFVDFALDHEDLHEISNVIGSMDMRMEVGSKIPMASLDTLLVASDGLFDNLYREEIVECVRKGPLEQAAKRLAGVCLSRMAQGSSDPPSKADDLTFILYRPL